MQRIPEEQKIVQLWMKTFAELQQLQAAKLILCYRATYYT